MVKNYETFNRLLKTGCKNVGGGGRDIVVYNIVTPESACNQA